MKKDKLIGILIYIYIIILLLSIFFSFFNKKLFYLFGLLIAIPGLIKLLIGFISIFKDGFKTQGIKYFNDIFKTIIYLSLAIIFGAIVLAWFFIPIFYLNKKTSFYYEVCLPILGGAIGEFIWILLYALVWGYIGYKIAKRIQNILKRFGIQ